MPLTKNGALTDYLTRRHLQYSVGFTLTDITVAAVDSIPGSAWTPAYDSDSDVREGAWVAELTGLIDLSGWPAGMPVIVRKERPHPGAQLRFTDRDGLRLTAFATNSTTGRLPVLELRQRRRARCEDRIRSMKDTGLRGLPLQGFDQNRIWIETACLAAELITWMQMVAFDTSDARRWGPKRCGCDCSPPRPASPATPGESTYGSGGTRPSLTCSSPPPHACKPPDQQQQHPDDLKGDQTGPVEAGSEPADRAIPSHGFTTARP